MSDEIDKAIAEGLAKHSRIIGYECRDCGETFDSGRDGRQHIMTDHDNPRGLKKLTE
jgi:hypothetical protein